MNRNVVIATVVGIAVIIGAVGYQVNDSMYNRTSTEDYYEDPLSVTNVVYPENPQFLHGLKINKDKYLLGERIYFSVKEIPMGLKDSLNFYTPEGIAYAIYSIDGDEKSHFKHYFRPSLFQKLQICDKEQLIGEWTVLFNGMPNSRLHFQVMSEFLPHHEEYYVSCNEDALQMPMIDPTSQE
jgi:hypothetical protein